MTQSAPSFRSRQVQCLSPAGLHRMAYKEWGDPDNPRVLVCLHGVTRVSDDFDTLAMALAGRYRVLCPDVVGRGRSDWLRDPQHYQIPQYVSDMVTLLARADAETVHWFGTSMGGLIGMLLASMPGSPIERLVLNDVGPALNPAALARIGDYIGEDTRFSSFEAGEQYIRAISAPFGTHTDEEWRKMTADVLREDKDGQWRRHYDPRIAVPIKASTPEAAKQAEAVLWHAYDAIRCPTLLVRGADSDLLSAETARAMTGRGPKAELVEFAGVGHAPTFLRQDQVDVAARFLAG
ncbi:alpha/beta fold hydrolase [Noviherbaspirillum galbum]|uniref:Alpha/beta hydrolase n=1 Tax=Noviherbaspirillum galbum TaxID=2709383 RepID=A0A6B3SM76_9BURK|nr:alpha/beta hydrolase [Noviherbaspirillum galbum]NEX61873.1 alpha/beta hydrolase [Noviherbaspirillum galbum]